jgi:hypothetical protein
MVSEFLFVGRFVERNFRRVMDDVEFRSVVVLDSACVPQQEIPDLTRLSEKLDALSKPWRSKDR